MKLNRATASVAGTLLAMAAATGSTQAQGDVTRGAIEASVGGWAESLHPKVVWSQHQICEELIHTPTPSKA